MHTSWVCWTRLLAAGVQKLGLTVDESKSAIPALPSETIFSNGLCQAMVEPCGTLDFEAKADCIAQFASRAGARSLVWHCIDPSWISAFSRLSLHSRRRYLMLSLQQLWRASS